MSACPPPAVTGGGPELHYGYLFEIDAVALLARLHSDARGGVLHYGEHHDHRHGHGPHPLPRHPAPRFGRARLVSIDAWGPNIFPAAMHSDYIWMTLHGDGGYTLSISGRCKVDPALDAATVNRTHARAGVDAASVGTGRDRRLGGFCRQHPGWRVRHRPGGPTARPGAGRRVQRARLRHRAGRTPSDRRHRQRRDADRRSSTLSPQPLRQFRQEQSRGILERDDMESHLWKRPTSGLSPEGEGWINPLSSRTHSPISRLGRSFVRSHSARPFPTLATGDEAPSARACGPPDTPCGG